MGRVSRAGPVSERVRHALKTGLASSADAPAAAATRRAESATLRIVYEGPDGVKQTWAKGMRVGERERVVKVRELALDSKCV